MAITENGKVATKSATPPALHDELKGWNTAVDNAGKKVPAKWAKTPKQPVIDPETRRENARAYLGAHLNPAGVCYAPVTREMGEAVLKSGDPARQADFIKAAAQQGLITKDPEVAGLVGQMLAGPNPLDQAAMRADTKTGGWYSQAFGALSVQDVSAVMKATTTDWLHGGMHGDLFAYDMTGTGARIVANANLVQDYGIRKKVFEGVAAQLSEAGKETSFLTESSGELGGTGPVMEQAGLLLLPAGSQYSTLTPAQKAAAAEVVYSNFRNDRVFSQAYDTFAKETVRANHQEALNPLLQTVESVALPGNDGTGGSERYSQLLGEIVGRQQRVTDELNSEGSNDNKVGLAFATGQLKEAAPLIFTSANGVPARFAAAAIKDLAPLLFSEPAYSSSLAPGMGPQGASEHVRMLRNAFTNGLVQGENEI